MNLRYQGTGMVTAPDHRGSQEGTCNEIRSNEHLGEGTVVLLLLKACERKRASRSLPSVSVVAPAVHREGTSGAVVQTTA